MGSALLWERLAPFLRVVMILLLAAASLSAAQTPKPTARAVEKRDARLISDAQRVANARPLAMYYYVDDARGIESLRAHAPQMTVLSPQCFWFDSEGFVHGSVPSPASEIARRARLPIMPLVVNRGFDRDAVGALLRSTRAQERAITYLAYLAKRDHYVGWQLDLENVAPADRNFLTGFVQRAAARLRREGRLLSLTVVPRFSDTFPDANHSGEFRTGEWGAPYDYCALGRAADFMVVMAYDHYNRNTPPGPVAGYAWVKEALEYAARRVPRQKLLLGIPFYSREWIETGQGITSRSLSFEDVQALCARPEVETQWDERWRTPWFQFRNGSALHTVWFEDRRSLAEKLRLMQQYRLRGFAAWRLGAEDQKFWALVVPGGKSQPAASGRAGKARTRTSAGRPASR